jgi:hypothetical protein
VKHQAGLNSPIIPLTIAVSVTKSDLLVGSLAAAGAGTGYIFREKITTLGAGAVKLGDYSNARELSKETTRIKTLTANCSRIR